MIKELAELCRVAGYAERQMLEHEAEVTADEMKEAIGKLSEALAKQTRPDAERAALMLLSAGQAVYGNTISDSDAAVESSWVTAVKEAERLLGIVPITPA